MSNPVVGSKHEVFLVFWKHLDEILDKTKEKKIYECCKCAQVPYEYLPAISHLASGLSFSCSRALSKIHGENLKRERCNTCIW